MKGRVLLKNLVTLASLTYLFTSSDRPGRHPHHSVSAQAPQDDFTDNFEDMYADRVQTKALHQEPEGYYFMTVYVGEPMQPKQLLIDTQANGTAIQYDSGVSMEAVEEKQMYAKVLMPSSAEVAFADGYVVDDEIALDKDELIAAYDFMFLLAKFIKYSELETEITNGLFNGVISFNRFGFLQKSGFSQTFGLKGKSNIMRQLIRDD